MYFQAIIATLQLRTPLHIGTGNETQTADDLVRRDGRGRLLIPGTALAGSLRTIATRLAPRLDVHGRYCVAVMKDTSANLPACTCLTCQLFGTINPNDKPRQNNEDSEHWMERTGRASAIVIYDAICENASACLVRDGVGIDRSTGAAARRERVKFTQEIVPADTYFKLRIELDARLHDDAHKPLVHLLAAVLSEWKEQRGSLGGSVARGLGAFTLSDIQYIEQDLNSLSVLMDFLHNGPPWQETQGNTQWLDQHVTEARKMITARTSDSNGQGEKDHDLVARSWVLIEWTLAATGPFLPHDTTQAGRGGFDHAPVLSTYAHLEQGARPVLPGSSVRGVLRSQAERIARTLATWKAYKTGEGDPAQARQYFLDHCPACNPLTASPEEAVASCNSFLKRLSKQEKDKFARQGADENLCLACRLFGSPWNGSRLRVEDARLNEGSPLQFKLLDFLAIDRFTGGGRDGAKFDALVLWKPKFSIRLLLENPHPWELGWLLLVLRDIHDGLTSVGFGHSKGFGQCCIEDYRLTIGYLHDTDLQRLLPPQQDGQAMTSGRLSGVYQTRVYGFFADARWLALTNYWVSAFNTEVTEHQRASALNNDSYFGVGDQLYPITELGKVKHES